MGNSAPSPSVPAPGLRINAETVGVALPKMTLVQRRGFYSRECTHAYCERAKKNKNKNHHNMPYIACTFTSLLFSHFFFLISYPVWSDWVFFCTEKPHLKGAKILSWKVGLHSITPPNCCCFSLTLKTPQPRLLLTWQNHFLHIYQFGEVG